MINRRVAEEIFSTAGLAVSAMSFCEVKDRDVAGPPDLAQPIQLRTAAGTTITRRSSESHGERQNGARGQAHGSSVTEQRLLSLSERVLELEEHDRIREELDRGATPDLQIADFNERLLAEALSRLSGQPICIEDAFGHISAAIGFGAKCPYPRLGAAARSRTAQLWLSSGTPVREPGRLVALALSNGEVLGAICMLETDTPVTANSVFALSYATRLLEAELSHRRALALLEVKLGRDLVDELVSGMEAPTAALRTEALGYDISGAQHVIVAEWQPQRTDDTVVEALRKTFLELRSPALVSRRANMAIAVVSGDPLGADVFAAVARNVRNGNGAVGIGGPCLDTAQIPRSFSEAKHALRIRAGSSDHYGVTRFDQLGIYRILDTPGGEPELACYVDEWLGTLQRTDDDRGSDLVQTLAQYLDHGGNYDSAAKTLTIHRSTLRYRLNCIRQITGFDLTDPETRLNLHVATRAWRIRPHGSPFHVP
ncbi:helix-turn-helix domain-containing protein [Arthrobacter sp. 260]|uniref:PucR family transcriptional regulator n=1 Tax=Arthrobacter sp. 260 TaxID=2735314 RepID=UPI001491714C|nr:helix-turn-helix domain-containing protein [Arthrobacter sp. 260]NOJ61157.1 helix-turn-helix domain-containing protein [Arthrobacter sp. 260]